MGFRGYLLKVGNYEITGEKFVNYESYKCTKNVQDLDAYRDSNGVLHRNAIEHTAVSVQFNTREGLNNEEVAEFMRNISSNYTVPLERKCTVSAFVPELNDYVTQEMYMAGPEFNIKLITKNTIKYKSTTIKFIGY